MRVYNICVYASYRVFECILGYAEPVIERLCFFFENKKFFIFFSSVSYTFRAGRGNAAVFVDYAVVNTTGKNKLSAESVPYLFRRQFFVIRVFLFIVCAKQTVLPLEIAARAYHRRIPARRGSFRQEVYPKRLALAEIRIVFRKFGIEKRNEKRSLVGIKLFNRRGRQNNPYLRIILLELTKNLLGSVSNPLVLFGLVQRIIYKVIRYTLGNDRFIKLSHLSIFTYIKFLCGSGRIHPPAPTYGMKMGAVRVIFKIVFALTRPRFHTGKTVGGIFKNSVPYSARDGNSLFLGKIEEHFVHFFRSHIPFVIIPTRRKPAAEVGLIRLLFGKSYVDNLNNDLDILFAAVIFNGSRSAVNSRGSVRGSLETKRVRLILGGCDL